VLSLRSRNGCASISSRRADRKLPAATHQAKSKPEEEAYKHHPAGAMKVTPFSLTSRFSIVITLITHSNERTPSKTPQPRNKKNAATLESFFVLPHAVDNVAARALSSVAPIKDPRRATSLFVSPRVSTRRGRQSEAQSPVCGFDLTEWRSASRIRYGGFPAPASRDLEKKS
jgi:hypothetical protein